MVRGVRRNGQIAVSHIDPDDVGVLFRRGVGSLNFKADQQVKGFARFVIPEFGRSDLRPALHEGHMLVVPCVGNHHAPIQREDAHVLRFLEAIVFAILILKGWGDIRESLVKPFVTFLRASGFTCLGILLGTGPQGAIGGTDLAGHATGHLCPHLKLLTDGLIGA